MSKLIKMYTLCGTIFLYINLTSIKLKRKKENGMIVSIDTEKAFHKIQKLFTSWQIDGERMEPVTKNFLGLQNHSRW